MGTGRDKSVYTQYNPSFQPLDVFTLSALYHGHDLAARVVEVVPDEELRLEFCVEIPGNEKAEKLVKEEFDRLGMRQNALDGRTWGRAFGGAATILGADDGRAAADPLDPERVGNGVAWLRTVDRRVLWPNTWYTYGPKNGQPETYNLNNSHPGGSETFVIHESRLILWPGARTAQQEKDDNNSWDYSILDRCWPALKAFETLYKGVELLVTEGPQAVYKVKGLFDKIVAGEEDQLRTRFDLIELYRSAFRAIIIDADGSESFERQQVTYSGTPEILNQMQLRLSAATQIPMMVLFGQSPGGLGVTGENDLKWFFDRTASSQRNVLAPRIERAARVVLAAAGIEAVEVNVTFPNLWTPSAKEQAEERLAQATTDEKYIVNQVLTPEEICLSRFRDKGKWSPDWVGVDRGVREMMLEDILKDLANGGPAEREAELSDALDTKAVEEKTAKPAKRLDFDPDQPRDDDGKWSETGDGGQSKGATLSGRREKRTLHRAAKDEFIDTGLSFGEEEFVAREYQKNPGFGGA
jgi:hypothetical protein